MIVSLTGTPGTGKTTVSEQLGFETVHLTQYVKDKGLGEQAEEFEVDTDEMIDSIQQDLEGYGENEIVVVEGHLAHHVPSDLCIVLRTNPNILEKRLNGRDYSESKIEENLEAEAMDIILSETISLQENILEIDTTDKTVEETVEVVKESIENNRTGYGDIDWSSWL